MVEQRSPLRSVQAVLFDAVGTLVYGDPNVVDVYHRLGSAHGSRLSKARVSDRFRNAVDQFHRCPREGDLPLATSQDDEYHRWRAIVAGVFADLSDTSCLFNELWSHFAQAKNWAVYDDVEATLQSLSKRGLQVGIASNFDQRLERIAAQLKPLARVGPVFHSAGLGVRKPAETFFRRIEHALSLAPHQLLLVGDSREFDYLAAKRAGWHALWLRRESDKLESEQVSDLRQLADVIAAC